MTTTGGKVPQRHVDQVHGRVTLDLPRWGDDGLIFSDREELIREWRVSEALASDIEAWGRASQAGSSSELDAEAARLIRLLDEEIGGAFQIVYKP